MGQVLDEARRLLSEMTADEKAQLLRWIESDLREEFLSIESTPGVCGGEPCVAGTRIPVWVLEQGRRLGMDVADLLSYYPTLRSGDIAQAWSYAGAHERDIDEQIRANEEA